MAERQTGMKLWLRLVLFASLALNLAVVGVVAGFALRGGPDREGGPRGRDSAFAYVRALDEADRHALRDRLRQDFRDRRVDLRDGAAEYREAVALLQAEPFAREEFEALTARQDARAETRQQAGRRALIDVLAAMTPQQRQAYADRLSEQIDRMERRWDRRDK